MSRWRRACIITAASALIASPALPQSFPCHPLERILAAETEAGRSFYVAEGWLAGRLAKIHREEAPVFYTLPAPSRTVLLTHNAEGDVIVGLILTLPTGVMVCAPLKFPRSEWAKVAAKLWGRNA